VRRIFDEVSRELKRFGPAGAMPRIVEVWPDAVGPTIARNAWPARVGRDGTLHVHTSSSSWAFELGQLQADVLRRLSAAAGSSAPRAIRFAVGKLPELGPEEAPRAVPIPTAEDARLAAELAAPIEDEELRELVARAAAGSLARTAADRPF
jgi:hypothetical protein